MNTNLAIVLFAPVVALNHTPAGMGVLYLLFSHVGLLWTELGRRRHAGLVGRLRERERELAAVEVLLERRGRMLLVEGRSGIGKTSLVEAARAGRCAWPRGRAGAVLGAGVGFRVRGGAPVVRAAPGGCGKW